jgi:hypothetical protein
MVLVELEHHTVLLELEHHTVLVELEHHTVLVELEHHIVLAAGIVLEAGMPLAEVAAEDGLGLAEYSLDLADRYTPYPKIDTPMAQKVDYLYNQNLHLCRNRNPEYQCVVQHSQRGN